MPYPFLVQLEDEIRAVSQHDFDVLNAIGHSRSFPLLASYRHAFHLRGGLIVGDIKIMSRMVRELNKWHARWGHGESPAANYPDDWDEHRFLDAYESMQMHQPFDMQEFLASLDKLTGKMLTRFSSIIIPSWKLSPDNDYWDMPNRTMAAMREAWHGKKKKSSDNWWMETIYQRYRYHRCHYFIYYPEPELWMSLIQNAKPSYVKGRFYAYTHAKDMSVLQEPMLRPYLADMRSFARKAIKAKK